MTLAFWKPKTLRVRITGPGRAYGDGTAVNTGDVVLLEESRAQALIDAGLAEITDAEIGAAAPLTPSRSCWNCGGDFVAFGDTRCPWCGSFV